MNFFSSNQSAIAPRAMAKSLRRLGWIGFWSQLILGFLPILILIIRVFFSPSRFNTTLGVFLAIACLLALLFGMYWCFHYVLLARQLESGRERPPRGKIIAALWFGLKINIFAMICGVLITMGRLATLTINMLRLPQGTTVITSGSNSPASGYLISPSEIITVQAMVNTIAAALVGVVISLFLLGQLTTPQPKGVGILPSQKNAL